MKKHLNWLDEGLSRYLSCEQRHALRHTRVGIAGTGGLGSNIAMMLARCGIRQFTLVDFDRIEASNLNRQFFFPDQVGQQKVTALAEHLYRLNPDMMLTLISDRLTKENIHHIFIGCQAIVEALDNVPDKTMCYRAFKNRLCFFTGASGLAGWKTEAMVYRHLDDKTVMVGDFMTGVAPETPPMAPRVMQAASMQANAVLAHILENSAHCCSCKTIDACS